MTVRAKLHTFDGEQLTVAQISALLPEYKVQCIRAHLRAGRNTTALIRGYRRTAPKPGRASMCFRFGAKIPHAMGGPPPMKPTPVT
jgi:hypothetical protein